MTAQEIAADDHVIDAHEPSSRTVAPFTDLPSMTVLMDAYGESVRRTAFRVTQSDVASQEIAQEVFLRAWSRGGYDPDRGSIEGWLRLIAHHIAVDWIRTEAAHRRRLMRVGVIHSAATAPVVEDEMANRSRAAQVRAAVAQLPTAERQAVSLAYFGGLTYREVAQRLGLAEGTVKSQIRRALTRLAHVLGSASTGTR